MAANTGVIVGGDIMLYINTGTEQTPVFTPMFHSTECSIKHSTELRKRKTKDTGLSSQKRAAEQTTTITVNALACYSAYNYFDLRTLQLAGTAVRLKYSGRPAQDVTDKKCSISEQVGDKYEEGMFIITALDRTDPNDADSTMTATFENSLLPEIKTVAAPGGD